MSAPKISAEPEASDRILTITRDFAAPRELVFAALTERSHALNWMGPRDYPVTYWESDGRPGGKWRACLTSRETGAEIWQNGINHEIEPPERLSFTFGWEEDGTRDRPGTRGPETLVTMVLDDLGGNRTRLHFRQEVFDTVANRDGHEAGWMSTFDRLQDYLNGL
ncbi:uncharacterized protein YndB with AHSA1/START domain [Dongia mobilis]|uniref:Uncharacterized protein YndB with AHSA1/START domain n=1 Tax=Dongia mobilis TaxID=578943 RepID=A0A4R6WRF1_9PROT|nr:SRPBCC domain-containing protein [Dongia mobilis]TDQ81044.1 uncharacterized protein YndB with AHSA1/START domain [Dongia mobilis]